MREPTWWSGGSHGGSGGALGTALLPVSWLYGATAWLHREVRARGLVPPRRLERPVIGVGSLVAGGAGKSPTAAWLAAALHRRGHRVVLATRGYGRRGSREPVTVLCDGRHVRADPTRVGDEPLVLVGHAPGVPVLVARDRGVAGLRAIASFDCDVLVLDDAFQHHRLHRDLDIVTLDGRFGLGNGRVHPSGPLREWPSALRAAHAMGVVDGPLPARDEARVAAAAPQAYRYRAWRVPATLRRHADGRDVGLGWLAGREVGLLAGLARPDGLRASLESLHAKVVAERVLPDHHRYRERDIRPLRRAAPVWITSEKDAVKILPSWAAGLELLVLGIELEVEREVAVVEWVEDRVGIGLGQPASPRHASA